MDVDSVPTTPPSAQRLLPHQRYWVPGTPSSSEMDQDEKEVRKASLHNGLTRQSAPPAGVEGKEEKELHTDPVHMDGDIAAGLFYVATERTSVIRAAAGPVARRRFRAPHFAATSTRIMLPIARARDGSASGSEQERPANNHQLVDTSAYNAPQRALSDRQLLVRLNRREVLSKPLYNGCPWTVQDMVVAL